MNSIVTITSLLFFLSELVLFLFKKTKERDAKIKQDKHSTQILWVVIFIAIFSGVFVANKFQGGLIHSQSAGMAILIPGFIIRWFAIYQLGKSFTVDVTIKKTHQITNTGLYRTIRHPSYLGLMMEFCGLSLLFNSWYSILLINIPIFIALHYRINVEEKLLSGYFGEEYERYKKQTKRLVPFVY